MKNNNFFKSKWQYAISHKYTNSFKVGETVFLKSNPEIPLFVYEILKNKIRVYWYDENKKICFGDFNPGSILQYKYAGLKIYHDKYFFCFN